MFVLLENRIRRVVTCTDQGPDLVEIDVVTGVRTMRANAGRRPGPGWRPSPTGVARKWVRFVDVVEKGRIVKRDALLDEYPFGMADYGIELTELDDLVLPVMQRAMAAAGPRGRRVRPDLTIDAIRKRLKRQGYPLPNEEEFENAIQAAWERLKPKSRRVSRGRGADGRQIIPPQATAPRAPTPPASQLPPDGYIMSEGHRWSTILKAGVPDGKKGNSMEKAVRNGWPADMLGGAETNRRGDYGYTLAYMGKKEYDAEKHGTAASIEVNSQ